jgi:DNA-directed RNA polymerase subunit RPC12/RpoP
LDDGRYTFNKKTPLKLDQNDELTNIRDDTEIDYGEEKFCKECGKKLNHINAKISLYCHSCKYKVLKRTDYHETKSSDKEITGG